MKLVITLITCLLITVLLFLNSCKKEYSCEKCIGNNKPPVAVAGLDTVITLPMDSVLLNGSKSSDSDGKISEWKWTKIAGPASFTIVSATAASTTVKNLKVGVYQFELKVTDDKGASAKDTVMITVDSIATSNHPPIACAGVDQTITLPTDTVTLDGSCSTDPDNNIVGYLWTKIAGPSSLNISNPNIVTTPVSNLMQGVYQFELKVTDAGGLFSKDTVQVTVDSSSGQVLACDNSIRPTINAQLIPIGTLSQARVGIAVEAAGNKVVFAGGLNSGVVSTRVDIFDFAANTWSTAELSAKRYGIAAVAAGNKIFFAGGESGGDRAKDVDIYDVTTNTWSLSRLVSTEGDGLATAAVDNKVFFAGGNYGIYAVNSVDIFDLTTNNWSTASLSAPRNYITAVSANNKVFFAGGDPWTEPISNRIDIYDNTTGGWSTSTLLFPRVFHAAIAVNDILYFAGGGTSRDALTCSVETLNTSTGARTSMYLSSPLSSLKAVTKNNKILFFEDDVVTSRLDIYDIATNIWSVGVLPQSITAAAIISVNNTVYVAGGKVNGVLSDKVWKLEY
jgi:hypothetical protein